MTEEKIKKAMPGRRDPECFELQHAVIIPKGTILRQDPGKPGTFSAVLAGGALTISHSEATKLPSLYKRVQA